MFLMFALLACDNEAATIQGQVLSGRSLSGSPVEGDIRILDPNGEVYDQDTLDPQGFFEATAPRGLSIYAVVEGEGIVPTSFGGTMGQGTFTVPPGQIFGWPEAERAMLDEAFDGCSGPGAVAAGEIALSGATSQDTGETPLLTTGFARLVRGETIVEACYLDDDGVYDPLATVTGQTGRYAIYGAEPGIWNLVYGYFIGDNPVEASQRIILIEDGVAPQYPALVDLAM